MFTDKATETDSKREKLQRHMTGRCKGLGLNLTVAKNGNRKTKWHRHTGQVPRLRKAWGGRSAGVHKPGGETEFYMTGNEAQVLICHITF